MNNEVLSKIKNVSAEKVFLTYMNLISNCEGEEVYRLIGPVGEGIMKHTHITKGIELVYSELDSYNPSYQEEKHEVDALEIMYIAEGHAEFELKNRQFVSGDKGDIMIFNSHTAVKKSTLGENGMNCISLIMFCEDTVNFLNEFLGTSDFSSQNFFSEIRKSNSVVTYPGNDLLEKLFLEMMKLPEEFSAYNLKLAVTHAILLMMQRKDKRDSTDLYFSGSTGRKVQNARIQLAKNLLATTELSITEIAGKCGYTNASKFSEVFKKHENILPKNWRD